MKLKDILAALFLFALFIFICSPEILTTSSEEEKVASTNHNYSIPDTQIYLMEKRSADVYRKEDNKIFINEEYIDSMSDPEKAALGYVSLFTLCQNLSDESLDFGKV